MSGKRGMVRKQPVSAILLRQVGWHADTFCATAEQVYTFQVRDHMRHNENYRRLVAEANKRHGDLHTFIVILRFGIFTRKERRSLSDGLSKIANKCHAIFTELEHHRSAVRRRNGNESYFDFGDMRRYFQTIIAQVQRMDFNHR